MKQLSILFRGTLGFPFPVSGAFALCLLLLASCGGDDSSDEGYAAIESASFTFDETTPANNAVRVIANTGWQVFWTPESAAVRVEPVSGSGNGVFYVRDMPKGASVQVGVRAASGKTSGKPVTVTRAADAGIEVVVATGRSLAAVAPQVLELPFLHYFITCNGSITTDREGHILRAAPLPLDTTLEILEHLTTMGDFAVQLYADQKMYLSRTDWEHRDFIHLPAFHLKTLFSSEESIVDGLMERARQPGTHLEKINMPYLTPEQKAEIKVWLAQRYGDRVRAVSTMECNLELTDREGSKGAALAALCQMLNIPTAQVMALGDADNDIGMLQTAGIGVAMSNAIPEVQAAADWITLSNEEDGVAHAIHSLLGI